MADANLPVVDVVAAAGNSDGDGAQFLTVPRDQFLTMDNMKHAVSIDTLASNEDAQFT